MESQDSATTLLHHHNHWFTFLVLLYLHTASVAVNTMFVKVGTVL